MALFKAIINKDIEYFDIHQTGELHMRLSEDINTIHAGLGEKIGWAIRLISMFASGLVSGDVVFSDILNKLVCRCSNSFDFERDESVLQTNSQG